MRGWMIIIDFKSEGCFLGLGGLFSLGMSGK